MDWSTRSKTSSVEPLVTGPSLSLSPTKKQIFTTRSGEVTDSPSPSESKTTPSITSTSLELEMETQEASSEKPLSSETTLDREMASSAPVELGKTSYGTAEDMTVGTTQTRLKQSTDQTGATGTAQTTGTTLNHLEGLTSSAKDSTESTHGNTTVTIPTKLQR
ncbi:hypothetical protein Q1695_004122 [Nippostrongylus brasiliensis]|nr:hypothetical protein Q1695_004122 [Nippostrongylus brasiliensis]